MPDEFFSGTDWQQSSERLCHPMIPEADIWPIDNNAEAAKDALADGLHPVVAVGGRTHADGRPDNATGVVISYNAVLSLAVIDLCPGRIVRQYVSNILSYDQGAPNGWEAAPVAWQPVYVDDSADLSAGCTLSMSDQNYDTLDNPLAGYLIHCQDEYADFYIGGPQSDATFPLDWSDDTSTEYEVCIWLTNAVPSEP